MREGGNSRARRGKREGDVENGLHRGHIVLAQHVHETLRTDGSVSVYERVALSLVQRCPHPGGQANESTGRVLVLDRR
eukprot:7099610-Prymnesium_polylepis.1